MNPVFSITIECINGKLVTWTQYDPRMSEQDKAKYEDMKRAVDKLVITNNAKQLVIEY